MSALAMRSDNADCPSLSLTQAEIEHFALHGYVVKKNVLDPDKLQAAVDVVWDEMPDSFDRGDPATWRGHVVDCNGNQSITARYGKVKLRDHIWGNETLDDLSVRNADIFAMVEQLLGAGNVVPPERFRGLYPIFPTPEHRNIPVRAHVDVTEIPFKVSVAAYLNDVPSGGGALMVWPGSHRTLFYDYETDSSSMSNTRTASFRKDFSLINRSEPVEITGNAGDIILFHYCLMHAAGINTIDGHVRHALFSNYRTPRCDEMKNAPRRNDIWDGWEGIRQLDTPAIRESSSPPADPLQGRDTVRGRNLMILVARGQRRFLKLFS